jgi:tetratricopeptide (TPR) repeat protein
MGEAVTTRASTTIDAPRRPKIAVYGICLNEEAFVKRFMDSCRHADMVIIADTGSTDGTVEAFRAEGAIVHSILVRPWRFDHARQAALQLVPEDVDICVSLDLDQVLAPGWRAILDRFWKPPANRLHYTLAWAKNYDGSPRVMMDNRIHARHGFTWRYPVHECLICEGVAEHILVIHGFKIDHLPDVEKSRGQYLPLLELAVEEEPTLPRHAHYLGREYYFFDRNEDAIAEFERHLALTDNLGDLERNLSKRLMAECWDRLGEPDKALEIYREAASEAPKSRGAQIDYGWALYQRERWVECYEVSVRACTLPMGTDVYGAATDTGVWPEDMASICGWRLGHYQAALDYGRRAMALAPNIERIRQNVERMETALKAKAG